MEKLEKTLLNKLLENQKLCAAIALGKEDEVLENVSHRSGKIDTAEWSAMKWAIRGKNLKVVSRMIRRFESLPNLKKRKKKKNLDQGARHWLSESLLFALRAKPSAYCAIELICGSPKLDPNDGKVKPLVIACMTKNLAAVKMLLSNSRTDPNVGIPPFGSSPLMICMTRRFPAAFDVLVEDERIDINQKAVNSVSAFSLAVANENVERMKRLIGLGAELDAMEVYLEKKPSQKVLQVLRNWKTFVPPWTTKTHRLFPADHRRSIRTFLLVNQRLGKKKGLSKDMVFYLFKALEKLWRETV